VLPDLNARLCVPSFLRPSMKKKKIEFSSHTGNLALMRSFVRTFLDDYPLSEKERMLMVLGVDEACTNVIRHAEGNQSTVSHSGVEFVENFGDGPAKLADMMGTFVGRFLSAQKANAAASADQSGSMLFQMGDARRARAKGYLAYLFDGKSWTIRRTHLGQQPRNGFTVGAYEDEDDLEALCRTYEAADEEGRNLIRLVAELSVSSEKK